MHIQRLICTGLTWLLRVVIAINFVRFGLSFFPQFEGTAQRVGAIDRLVGGYTVFGFFRPDFAWLVASTAGIFATAVYLAKSSKNSPHRRLDLLLCQAWIAAFAIYVIKSLLTGVLYPG